MLMGRFETAIILWRVFFLWKCEVDRTASLKNRELRERIAKTDESHITCSQSVSQSFRGCSRIAKWREYTPGGIRRRKNNKNIQPSSPSEEPAARSCFIDWDSSTNTRFLVSILLLAVVFSQPSVNPFLRNPHRRTRLKSKQSANRQSLDQRSETEELNS